MIGKTIYRFDELNSTNEYIKNNTSKLAHGDVVLAYEQIKGKGRHGNEWISPKGNLYFSFIMKERMERRNVFSYVMRVSIAVNNTLLAYSVAANIKYPNDIIVGRKKIAGILLESLGYKTIDNIIIGIGINVNQIEFEELSTKATSIYKETKKEVNIDEILQTFIKEYNKLQDNNRIYKLYLNKLKFNKNIIEHKEKSYKIDTVMPEGTLRVYDEENAIYLDYNDLSFSDIYDE